ncbi:putative RNA-directed DNA polymerase from transposon X-element, partial [Araneus ventricosus]
MATQNETIDDSKGVSADPIHFALSVCNSIDISKCTGSEECDIYVCKIDACLDTLEKVSPQSVELSNAIHLLDRSLNRILHRKISILTTLLSNQIIANAYTNSHANNIFSDGGSDSESSSTSNAFHKKSKKNRRSPQKDENASKKIKQSFEYQINTSNRFANLENEHDDPPRVEDTPMNSDNEINRSTQQDSSEKNSGKLENPNLKNFQQSQTPQNEKECSIKEKIPYVPPIVIDNPKNVPQLLQTLSALTEEIVTGRMISSDKLKIFPPTSEAHRKIQRQITKDGLKSHTFELNDEKKIKIVIRGLDPDHDVSVIMQELARQGFTPELCHPLRHRQSNKNMPLFLVVLPKIPKSKEIYYLEYIGQMRVSVESLRKKQTPGQCYKCQDYFHHSSRCTRDPRCMKCAGNHWSRDCPKPKETPATCLHCKGNHTANYSGCPRNPLNRKSFPTAPANAWSDPTALAKVKETPKSDSNLKPVTQFLPRSVELSHKMPSSQEEFFKQMSTMMTSMIWNAGGIKPKFNQFKYFAQEWKPDVIAIQESHLNPGDKLKLVNYTTYRTDRLTHRGGGTALFIRNSIDHYPTPIASDSFENTTIAIVLPNSQQITVSSIYRPPHGIISTDELNRIFNSNNKCIAVGDFNAKHSAWSLGRRNQNGNIINDYICNNNLILLAPPEPTHFPHNGNNPSTLDFGVLKNFSSGDATSLNELCSDHNPVSFEIDINANIPAITKTLKTTNWMKFYDITKEAIPGNPSINSTKDIDEVINKITAVILTAINQSSKAKIINGPHRKLPPRITNKITLRNQIKKRWQITYDPRFKRKSTQLTNEIKADINQYDQDSWTEWLLSLNQEDLSIYNATRKYSRKFHKIPPILDTDGLKYTPLGKANAFKYLLENSFQTNPEPYDNRHISEVNRAVQHFLNSMRNDNNIKLTSPLEIQAIIKKINPKKATGPDGIPNKALKMIPPNLLTCITKVFNKCLLHHYFPPSWKIAHVLMFPKPGQNHKLPGNYRPISLLSNLGKIYEKVILARLKEHCSDLQIIPDEQYGFRPNHGCVHQLLRVTNLITHGFNNKLYTGGVFLDVRKAFDRMWHNGLIYKLIANKLPHYLIDIIILFLLNRTFKVKLNSTLSETGHIKAGTPQGSILSPLLYTVYTADFPVNNHITNCFFADDTAILAQGSTTKFVIRTLQRGLIEIEKWCTLWRVAINTDKTRSVMFRKGHPRNNL